MRVLVTGGAGFIGSHTVDRLLTEGYTVRILDALSAPVHNGGELPVYVPVRDVEVLVKDIRDSATWEHALDGVDAVFHLAAYQDYLPDFSTFFHVNTVSTALLYETIARNRLPISKVVIASSQAVYGEGKYQCNTCQATAASGKADTPRYPEGRDDAQLRAGRWDVVCPVCGMPMEPQWIDESCANPHTAYGISKYSQELIAMQLGKRCRTPTVCLRYSIVQGPRQSFRNAYSGVLRIFAQRILTGKAPICYEDGEQLRDYVSVHDVVAANLLVLADARADFRVLNVGGDRRVSVLEYARMVAGRAGSDIEPEVPGVYRVGDTRHAFSDVSSLKLLGWQPAVAVERIIDEYLAWIRDEPVLRDHSTEADAKMQRLGVLRAKTASGTARR